MTSLITSENVVCESPLQDGRVPEPSWEGRAVPWHPWGQRQGERGLPVPVVPKPSPHRGASSHNLAAAQPPGAQQALLGNLSVSW